MFINLDSVTETLINETTKLAVQCHALVKGKHTQKTQTFVKACIAYVHITIPTIESSQKQCRLFQQAAQVALMNGLIGETDSLIRAALQQLDENFDPKIEGLLFIVEQVLHMLGFLVIVPSNPEEGFFQIVEGIVQLIKLHDWSADASSELQVRIYAGCVSYLASQVQDKLPYQVDYVNSNDQIFIGNDEFKQEANQLMDDLFAQVLEVITKLNEEKVLHSLTLFMICLKTANLLIVSGNAADKKVGNFANKMFKMSDGYMTEYN